MVLNFPVAPAKRLVPPMTVLKLAAEGKFSVCRVWAQPRTRAINAKAEARLKSLKICCTAFCFPDWLLSDQFDGPLLAIARD